MEACSGQEECLPQKLVELTSFPSAVAFVAEEFDSESMTWNFASASLESVMSHSQDAVSCDAAATLEAAHEQHDESMDQEKNVEEEMSSTAAVEDFGGHLRDAVGQQTVDPTILIAEPSLSSMFAQDSAIASDSIFDDAMGLEEVMRTAASDHASESLMAQEIVRVTDAVATIEAVVSELAAESAVASEDAPESVALLESVPQQPPVASTPQNGPRNSPKAPREDIGIDHQGQPVSSVRKDPGPGLGDLISTTTPHIN